MIYLMRHSILLALPVSEANAEFVADNGDSTHHVPFLIPE
ncbi:protein of unknown function [Burkholderia multivorans]